ncbi:ADP-ribose pyrophosphatase [Deinococcus aquaticus]|uniref:ADP-ribose pyrophosphatase n=1 Tax=Deinococcus aquaticus TaxID=328692 RepID=UPI00362355DA
MPPASRTPGALAVYIGRFQPLHDAHLHTIQAALHRHAHLLVLTGSANLARSAHNPWTAPERARLIRAALRESGHDTRRLSVRPLPDEFDAGLWAAQVQAAVAATLDRLGPRPVVLTGFEKDASSGYLRWFPQWQADPVPAQTAGGTGLLNATDLRAALLGRGEVPPHVPPAVQAFLRDFLRTRTAARLSAEYHAIQAARAALSGTPTPRHERLDLHTDAHTVWLARRDGPIGRGLWALPATPSCPATCPLRPPCSRTRPAHRSGPPPRTPSASLPRRPARGPSRWTPHWPAHTPSSRITTSSSAGCWRRAAVVRERHGLSISHPPSACLKRACDGQWA